MSSPPLARRAAALLPAMLVAPLLASCAFRSFVRETETTGTFRTEAISFRFLAFFEVPFIPRHRALELAHDWWGENVRVTRFVTYPDLGIFQFLNGLVIGWRGAIVEGEYGIPPDTEAGRAQYEAALRARGQWYNVDGSPVTPSDGLAR